MRHIFLFMLFAGFTAFAKPLEISVEPIGVSEKEQSELKERILKYPNIENLLRNKTFRILTFQVENFESKSAHYILKVYSYTDGRSYEMTGPLNRSTLPQVREATEEIPATPEEFAEAEEVVAEISEYSGEIKSGRMNTYEPIPGTSSMSLENQQASGRLINVGVVSVDQPKINEIVGVDLYSRQIIHYPNGAPEGALAVAQTCGLPNARQATTSRGTSGSARIEISRGGQNLWTFTVVRPSASSGREGSGLEIRNLYYRGQKVLTRAHTPILNVQYEGNRCGPFRDWTYSENSFVANGVNRAPGIRIANSVPQTIFDTQIDRGNFRGVAIHDDGTRVLLVTELSAGWYRYISKFELLNDGTIKPTMEFSAVENSCVCFSHNHHVYWRFDFDIGGTRNSVHVSNGTALRPIPVETKQVKSSENQWWRISNPQTGRAYNLVPGSNDGRADSFSIADAWLLRYSSTQIDDSRVRTSKRAALDAFITGGSLINQDLVFWYSGHLLHNHEEAETVPAIVGPTLTPVNWTLTTTEE